MPIIKGSNSKVKGHFIDEARDKGFQLKSISYWFWMWTRTGMLDCIEYVHSTL